MPNFPVAALTLLLAFVPTARGAESGATEAQVRELLEVSQTRKLLDQVIAQMEPTLKRSMDMATAGKQLNTQQQQVMEEFRGNMVQLMRQQLSWDDLSPMFIKIYRDNFSSAEMLAMLKFYRSPTGKAMVAKMPAVMQQTNDLMLARMSQSLFPKLQELSAELASKLQAASAPEALTAPTTPPAPAAAAPSGN